MITSALFFLFSGAILHIAEDAFTGKIPTLKNPRKKHYTKLFLFRTGTPSEYLFALIISALFITIRLIVVPYKVEPLRYTISEILKHMFQ